MKTISLLYGTLFLSAFTSATAQNTWTQKANIGVGGRNFAVGFYIGSKGYIGTGETYPYFYNDFWEYNPATNAWTQKANVGGGGRTYAVGFSIGTKGYIGTGFDGAVYKKDFWEYSPATNLWTQKANFGGAGRAYAVGFSIGNKGYLGTGYSFNSGYFNDIWAYDPASDSWTQTTSFPTSRFHAVAFSAGGKGYISTGSDSYYKADLWEYNPSTSIWTQKANFAGTARINAVGFGIGTQGFIATGFDNSYRKDLWQYDPATNTWTQKAQLTGTARSEAVGFSIGAKAYIGTGFTGATNSNDFFEYLPDSTICPIPINLSVSNLMSTSATLSWSAVTGAQAYRIRYKAEGSNIWIKKTTTPPSKSISGLLPNTTYKWEVQTFCQLVPHVKSDWSPGQLFTTPLRIANETQQQISFDIYPNPADDYATVQFMLPHASHVYIKVYDMSGKDIETAFDGEAGEGEQFVTLHTNQFPKGAYLVKLISDSGIQNKVLIVE